eukprot:6455529-Amphidinium_carterae.1
MLTPVALVAPASHWVQADERATRQADALAQAGHVQLSSQLHLSRRCFVPEALADDVDLADCPHWHRAPAAFGTSWGTLKLRSQRKACLPFDGSVWRHVSVCVCVRVQRAAL